MPIKETSKNRKKLGSFWFDSLCVASCCICEVRLIHTQGEGQLQSPVSIENRRVHGRAKYGLFTLGLEKKVLKMKNNLLKRDYLVCTSASCPGVPGSNLIASPKSCEVYPGLSILQLADCCPSKSLKQCFGLQQTIIIIIIIIIKF